MRRPLQITALGDDLYCRQPLCEAIREAGMDVILVGKPSSHPTLYEWLSGLQPATLKGRRWTGRGHQYDPYRYLNGLPLRDGDEALHVNNTLKTKGYHFEHNYGHGHQQLAAVLATFMLLALLFHTVLSLVDRAYRQRRDYLSVRTTFFDDLRALTRYICFPGWEAMREFMRQQLELKPP